MYRGVLAIPVGGIVVCIADGEIFPKMSIQVSRNYDKVMLKKRSDVVNKVTVERFYIKI